MSWALKGRTALVTGGAKRIGAELAAGFARAGVNVAIHYRRSSDEAGKTAAVCQKAGVRAECFAGDLGDSGSLESLFANVVKALGPVDILINSASEYGESSIQALDAETFFRTLRVNAWAPLALGRAMAVQKRDGVILNILDSLSLAGDPTHVAYQWSKQLLSEITRAQAIEFAPRIRVNGIAPGPVLSNPGRDPTWYESLTSRQLLKRRGIPQDVVEAALFLAQSEFATGEVIHVDHGLHLQGSVR